MSGLPLCLTTVSNVQKTCSTTCLCRCGRCFHFSLSEWREKGVYKLCHSRSHYHVVTADVQGKDLYGQTN